MMKRETGRGRFAWIPAAVLMSLFALGPVAHAAPGVGDASGIAAKKGSANKKQNVPEIDPALLMGMLIIVIGGTFFLMDRAHTRRAR